MHTYVRAKSKDASHRSTLIGINFNALVVKHLVIKRLSGTNSVEADKKPFHQLFCLAFGHYILQIIAKSMSLDLKLF